MENEATYQDLSEMMGKIPENYCILEEEIDIDIHLDYQAMVSRSLKEEAFKKFQEYHIADRFEYLLALIESENLSEERLSEIKQLIIFIVHSGESSSFDLLKELEPLLLEDPLKSWLKVALLDCKVYLENQLLGTNKHIVITGLGGKGKQLRYNIVGLIEEDIVLSDFQKDTVKKEFEYAAQQNNCEIESLVFYEKYLVLLALVPLKVSLEKLIAAVVKECHLLGVPLKKEYLVTNVKQLSELEIADFIEHKAVSLNTSETLEKEGKDE